MSSEQNCADKQQEGTRLQLFLSFVPVRRKENEMGIVFSSESLQALVILSATVDISPHLCLPPLAPDMMFLPPVPL